MLIQWTLLSRIVQRAVFAGASRDSLRVSLALMAVTVVCGGGCRWAREYASLTGAAATVSLLRQRFFDQLLLLGPVYTAGERTGELVETGTSGVDRVGPYVGRYLPQLMLSTIVPLLIGGYVLTIDWLSGAMLLTTAPVIVLLLVLVGSYSEDHTRRQWQALTRMSASFLDAVQGLPTLKLFGQGEAYAARLDAVSDGFRRRTMAALRYAFLSGLVLEFMTTGAIALVAVVLGVRLLDGKIAFQPAFLVLLLTPEFYRPLRELGTARHAAFEGRAAAERVREVLETPATAPHTASLDLPATNLTIAVDNLTMRYPGADVPALDGVSLELSPGTRTALVGPSGAGKSTLVAALLAFIAPEAGSISVNGLPLDGLPRDDWRRRVALVPQRPTLFAGSIADNIRLARPEAGLDAVRAAAELAGAADFIEALRDGYETRLGERGARLSQGQVQRVAIARAVLQDAPLLILDEPSSSLDPESEDALRLALERLARGRTVLIVAHRLNTVRSADRLVVLDAGRVVETGTHDELLARGGLYARLVGQREAVPA